MMNFLKTRPRLVDTGKNKFLFTPGQGGGIRALPAVMPNNPTLLSGIQRNPGMAKTITGPQFNPGGVMADSGAPLKARALPAPGLTPQQDSNFLKKKFALANIGGRSLFTR